MVRAVHFGIQGCSRDAVWSNFMGGSGVFKHDKYSRILNKPVFSANIGRVTPQFSAL